MTMDGRSLDLRVDTAYSRDVGLGVARIDYDSMAALGASTGDVIEIKGKKRTVAKCLPLYPSDEGKGIIRMDGLGRDNSGVAVGDDAVSTRKTKAVPAGMVVLARPEAGLPVDVTHISGALAGIPLTKGNNVAVPYFGGALTLRVADAAPASGAVLVTPKTALRIVDEPLD